MAQFQKFMFDNFIISCDDEKCVAEPVVEPEIENESAPSETPEVIVEPRTIEITEVETPISYTQEELDQEIKRSEERGYERGYQLASSEQEQRTEELLNNINTRLIALLAESAQNDEKREQQSLRFTMDVITKLFPTLEKEQAVSEINKFMTDNFPNFRREAYLSFSFNPEVISEVSSIIAKLANSNDFEGKISVHKDASLGASDCRIEWENGGVERNTHKMLEKVNELLDDKMTSTEERDNG